MNSDREVAVIARLLDKADKAADDAEHWRWEAAERIAGLVDAGVTVKAIAAGVNRSTTVVRRYVNAWADHGRHGRRPAFSTLVDGHHAEREQVSPVNRPAAMARWAQDDDVVTDDTVVEALASSPAFLAKLGRTMRDQEAAARTETNATMRERHGGLSDLAGWAAVGLLVDRAHRATVQALEHVHNGDLGRRDRTDTLRRAQRLGTAVEWLVAAIESPDIDLDDALASLTDTP